SGRSTGTTTTETRGGNNGTGAIDLAARGRDRGGRGDAARQDDFVRGPRLGRASRGAAPRRPADRRRRLPGRAQLLDRVGPGWHAGRAHSGAHRRRRGLTVPNREPT